MAGCHLCSTIRTYFSPFVKVLGSDLSTSSPMVAAGLAVELGPVQRPHKVRVPNILGAKSTALVMELEKGETDPLICT